MSMLSNWFTGASATSVLPEARAINPQTAFVIDPELDAKRTEAYRQLTDLADAIQLVRTTINTEPSQQFAKSIAEVVRLANGLEHSDSPVVLLGKHKALLESAVRKEASQVSQQELDTIPLLSDRAWVAQMKAVQPNFVESPQPGTEQYEFCQLFWTLWVARPLTNIEFEPKKQCIAGTGQHLTINREMITSVLSRVNVAREWLAGFEPLVAATVYFDCASWDMFLYLNKSN